MPMSQAVAVAADADTVFGVVTDVAGLPSWNAAMTSVVAQPDRLDPGSEWVVEFHALGQTWRSRSTVEVLDTRARRFSYRSGTDDGNPSYARWTWEVAEDPVGSRVTVSWTLHPITFWRRLLLVRIRSRQLARQEVPASLAALRAAAVSRVAGQPRSRNG